jgi:hypothetical protein
MWSRFTRSSHVFALVGFILHICGPLVIPAIVASKSAPIYVVKHGLQICSDISNAPLDHAGKVEGRTAMRFVAELEDLGSFMHTVLSLPPNMIRDIHSEVARAVFDFATRAISTMGSPIIPQSKLEMRAVKHVNKILADYAAMLYAKLPDLENHYTSRHPFRNGPQGYTVSPSRINLGIYESCEISSILLCAGMPRVSPIIGQCIHAMQRLSCCCVLLEAVSETRLDRQAASP